MVTESYAFKSAMCLLSSWLCAAKGTTENTMALQRFTGFYLFIVGCVFATVAIVDCVRAEKHEEKILSLRKAGQHDFAAKLESDAPLPNVTTLEVERDELLRV